VKRFDSAFRLGCFFLWLPVALIPSSKVETTDWRLEVDASASSETGMRIASAATSSREQPIEDAAPK